MLNAFDSRPGLDYEAKVTKHREDLAAAKLALAPMIDRFGAHLLYEALSPAIVAADKKLDEAAGH